MKLTLALAFSLFATASVADTLTITDAYIMNSTRPDMAMGFMMINNNTDADCSLVGSSSTRAGNTELHETFEYEGRTYMMQTVEQIDIPAGQSVELWPASYHVMLLDIDEDAPLVNGEFVDLTMDFGNCGNVTLEVEVDTPVAHEGHENH